MNYGEIHWSFSHWSDFQAGFRGAFAAPVVTSVVTVDSDVANKGTYEVSACSLKAELQLSAQAWP